MKIVIVLLTHIDNLPPARNLLLSLSRQKIGFDLVTMFSEALPKEIKDDPSINVYDVQNFFPKSKFASLICRFKRRKKVRKILRSIINKDDVIWTVTDYDTMEVGKFLSKCRHVMQLMELVKDIPIFDEIPLIKAHLQKYAKHAELLIVPEYNRAHIQKSYWNLKQVPVVLPNKPHINLELKQDICSISPKAGEVLRQIGDKKIILYQGTFGYERVLDQFIEAVHLLGDDYCVLLMGRDDAELNAILQKYPDVFFIPFISAPNHLLITQKAHIGILSYVNVNNIRHYDPLNAIYCAPNKIYEYACFGIPMIGNDVPGLSVPFKQYNMGVCSDLSADAIAESIKYIEEHYIQMSENCKNFYSDTDFDKIVYKIVKRLKSKTSN